ncbi:MAG: hypothetical protein ACYDFT_08770 [Thermoplasmata archaeon]
MSASRVIITRSRGHQYRRRVEYVYDPKRKRTVPRVLENLGPVEPIYRRPSLPPVPESFSCTPLQFGLLADHLINGTLTAPIAVRLIGGQAVRIPPETLEALGIRVVLGKKTKAAGLEFLLWRSPPSSPLRPARVARRSGRSSSGATPPTSSPSRDRSA